MSEDGTEQEFEVVADIVTEDGYPVSVSSTVTRQEFADSLSDELQEKFAVRALFMGPVESDDDANGGDRDA